MKRTERNHCDSIVSQHLKDSGYVSKTTVELNILIGKRYSLAKKYQESNCRTKKSIIYAEIIWIEESIKKLLNLE